MEQHDGAPVSLKQKALYELKRFWIISLYLMVFLGCFNLYRRLILAGVGVDDIASYGWRLVEALVLAKVILIGEALHIGEGHERSHLIVPVLRKSAMFGLLIMCFNVLERATAGLIHREDWAGIVHHIFENGVDEMLARTLVMAIALIPFFGFVELEKILGPGKLTKIFFSKNEIKI